MERAELNITKAGINELVALQAFARETFFDTYAQYNTAENMRYYHDIVFSKQNFEEELLSTNTEFYISKEEKSITGYIKLNFGPAQTDLNDPDSMELERIYISKHAQGRGLGKALLQKAIEEGVRRQKQYIWLGVWDKNETALVFYKKNGFKPFGTHKFILGKEEQNDILMKQALTN